MAPIHEHSGFEHILMLDGRQEDEHGTYGPGAFVINSPGSRHSVKSPEGCVALLIWERPVRFIEGGS
ncbi:MAG: cupin domain-containing protein [Geminicoccales bacterium]